MTSFGPVQSLDPRAARSSSATTNKRCPAKEHLEIDHIIPRSRGGKGIEQNPSPQMQNAHNRLAAEQIFGRGFIDAKINERRSRM
jgi:hypothetical protein